MPVFAAIFSRIFLGEPIRNFDGPYNGSMWQLDYFLSLTVLQKFNLHHGKATSGLYVSIAFAAALTAVRSARAVSMIPAIPFGYIGGALVLSFFISPFKFRLKIGT